MADYGDVYTGVHEKQFLDILEHSRVIGFVFVLWRNSSYRLARCNFRSATVVPVVLGSGMEGPCIETVPSPSCHVADAYLVAWGPSRAPGGFQSETSVTMQSAFRRMSHGGGILGAVVALLGGRWIVLW